MFSPIDSLDLSDGSQYNFGDKQLDAMKARSVFDLSHLVSTTIRNGGYVVPLTWFETLPGDDHELQIENLIRLLPQSVPLFSRQRVYMYAFYSRYSDLWNNFNTFMTKGYNVNVKKFTPKLTKNVNHFDFPSRASSVGSMSLGDYLGIPQGSTSDSLTGDFHCQALPFMMYLRIYRDYFMNKNYHIDDRVLLPDDDSRFRLDDDGQLLSAKDNGVKVSFDFCSQYDDIYYRDSNGDVTPTKTGIYDTTHNILNVGLFFHDYSDDRFTTALPWPQRYDPSDPDSLPKINVGAGADFAVLRIKDQPESVFRYTATAMGTSTTATTGYMAPDSTYIGNAGYASLHVNSRGADSSEIGIDTSNLVTHITLNQVRELAIAQTELEKLARTDGSYYSFAQTFFSEKPRNAFDFRPTYIGGTYQDILFSEVLQTSAATSETSTPLGSYAGHGVSANSNGYLGKIHCDDYGMIMILACVMPETYYSQGISKSWTRKTQNDMYLPERSKLGMIPLLNHEIYFTSDDSSLPDTDKNEGLWAWTNIYDEYRYIPNRICGDIARFDVGNELCKYTQARHFESLPHYGRAFSEGDDVSDRNMYLPHNLSPVYLAQFKLNVRSVRLLPYRAVPAFIIN